MKVEIETTITTYGDDCVIKPTAPIWRLENDGYCPMVINDTFAFEVGATIGVDGTNLVGKLLEKNIPVQNDTEYKIAFVNDTRYNYTKSALLIQTFVKYKNS